MYIYIAGPYTNGDTILNIRRAITVADRLVDMGHTPFIPHMTYAWHMVSPHTDINFWYEYDLKWLEKCDALFRIIGDSHGADQEVLKATLLGLPVFMNFNDIVRWEQSNG
jgi:hypothetical protein